MADLTGSIIVTTAGRAELLSGTFHAAELALGTGSWSPTAASDALAVEVARVPLEGQVDAIGDNARLHLNGTDGGAGAYAVREFAVFDGVGTCLLIYSQATDIAVKATGSSLLFSIDFVIIDADTESIEVGDTTYQLPAATTSASGIVELATGAETATGTDAQRAVTPLGLTSRTATLIRTGLVELATGAETSDGVDNERAVTPLGLLSRTASTTRIGLARFSTSAETEAGVATDRAVTPASLLARTALTTRAGVVQLATGTEVATGTDAAKAITPSTLLSRTALTTRTGVVQLATSAEAEAGTVTTKAVTPSALRAGVDKHTAQYASAAPSAVVAASTNYTVASMTGLVPSAKYAVTVHALIDSTNAGFVGALANGVLQTLAAYKDRADEASVSWTWEMAANGSGALTVQVRNNLGSSMTIIQYAVAAHRTR